jgi:hypothetical protein
MPCPSPNVISLDEATSIGLHKTTSSPTLQRPPYVQQSSSTRLDSIERRPRRTSSSQRAARPQETNYDELFQTPPRLSRNRTRSRRGSQQSSRNHTPTRPPLYLPAPPIDGTQGLGLAKPLAPSNAKTGPGSANQKGHKRTNSGGTGAGGYWRAGHSVSLTSAKPPGGAGAGFSFGKSVGPTRRLAKMAHMHEVKPLRGGSTGTGTSTSTGTGTGADSRPGGPERRHTMADELDASLSLPVLSPMMENPYSAGMLGFGDAVPRGSGPVRIGGFDARMGTALSEGVLSDPFSSGLIGTSSSGLGIPFPSPALDYEGEGEGEEDVWVDEGGDEESFLGGRSALGLGLPSSSPTRVKGGSGFSFGSPRKFVFASSPPGKAKIKRRSDAAATAAGPDLQLGGTPTPSSTHAG